MPDLLYVLLLGLPGVYLIEGVVFVKQHELQMILIVGGFVLAAYVRQHLLASSSSTRNECEARRAAAFINGLAVWPLVYTWVTQDMSGWVSLMAISTSVVMVLGSLVLPRPIRMFNEAVRAFNEGIDELKPNRVITRQLRPRSSALATERQ